MCHQADPACTDDDITVLELMRAWVHGMGFDSF